MCIIPPKKREREGVWAKPQCCVSAHTRSETRTFQKCTRSHINTLNWSSGYTATHLAAPWAKGSDEPAYPPPPTHTHCDSLRQKRRDGALQSTQSLGRALHRNVSRKEVTGDDAMSSIISIFQVLISVTRAHLLIVLLFFGGLIILGQ